MGTPYKYVSSIDYIKNLSFDYIETYSFQRGADFEEQLKHAKSEHDRLKVRKEKRNNLTQAEEERFSELNGLVGFTQYLINDKGDFHPASKKINTFQTGDPIITRLVNILQTEIRDIPRWMCAPTYRDAVVFCDKDGKIVSVLNVCLSCQYMETAKFSHVNGDYETYDLLKRFFVDIGHEVEDPTNFIGDEMNRLREKYKS